MKEDRQHKESRPNLIQSKQGKSKLSFVDNRPQTKLVNSIQKKESIQSQHSTPIIQFVKEGGSADERAKAEKIETLIQKYNTLKIQYDLEVARGESIRFKTKGLIDFVIHSIINLLTHNIKQLIDDDKVAVLNTPEFLDEELSQASEMLNMNIDLVTVEDIPELSRIVITEEGYRKVASARASGSDTIDGGRGVDLVAMEGARSQWDVADSIIKNQIREKGLNISPQELYDLIYDTNIALNKSSSTPGKNRLTEAVSSIPLKDIPKQLYTYCVWLSTELTNLGGDLKKSVVLATQAAVRLNTIHPFTDGNGRTVKLITDYILISSGLAPQRGKPLEIYNAEQYDTLEKKNKFMVKQKEDLLKKIEDSRQEIQKIIP